MVLFAFKHLKREHVFTIVTPTEKNTPEAVETCVELGRLLGF